MVATISGGTIPDRGLYTVNLPDKTRLGELDEEFVHESRVGDAFQLGSSTWRIRSIEHDRVVVVPAPGAPARMPFWHGEFMARSRHLARRVGTLRRTLDAAVTLAQVEAIAARLPGRPRDDAVARRVRAVAARDHRDRAGRPAARAGALPRRGRERAHGAARAVRRPRERAVGHGARAPHARAARRRRAGADDRRRRHAAPARHGRRAADGRRSGRWARPRRSSWCWRRSGRRRCSARASA